MEQNLKINLMNDIAVLKNHFLTEVDGKTLSPNYLKKYEIGICLFSEKDNIKTIIRLSEIANMDIYELEESIVFESYHPCLIDNKYNQPSQMFLSEVLIINKHYNDNRYSITEVVSNALEQLQLEMEKG